MSAGTSAAAVEANIDDVQPRVLILDGESGQLEQWLASHPPSRLGAPASLNNGVAPQPIWVLAVPSVNDLSELSSTATADETFIKANEMVRDATDRVAAIQSDNGIPTRNTSRSPSKKAFRDGIQKTFHDQILTLTSDHPLWSQGKWTIIIRPTQIDSVFSQLANSLASGVLQEHGSILALRARTLPTEESNMDTSTNGSKRPKTSHGRRRSSGSSKSPTSSQQAQTMLGIDVFFRPVWSTTAARDVLKRVAGVSGRMPQFCKSSLYSRLGIRKGHQIDNFATLYNSKTLATPAEVKHWVQGYVEEDGKVAGSSDGAEAGPSSSKGVVSTSAQATSSMFENTTPTKRALERENEKSHNCDEKAKDEPALKKPRNGESDRDDSNQQANTTMAVEPASAPTSVGESQDEPMLPVRPTSAQLRPRLPSVPEEEREEPTPAVAATESAKIDETPDEEMPTTVPKQEDESQTQLEPIAAVEAPVNIEKDTDASLKAEKKNGNGSAAPSQKQVAAADQHNAGAETVPEAENNAAETKPNDQSKEQSAVVSKPSEAAEGQSSTEVKTATTVQVQSSTKEHVIMATEVRSEVKSSFTPAFGDDVVKAPATSNEQKKAIEPNPESIAGPMILQQTSVGAEAKVEAVEPGEIKADISARFARLATPPPQERSAISADIRVLAQVPAPQKADASEDFKQAEHVNNPAALTGVEDKEISGEHGAAVDSNVAAENAQEEKTDHVDEGMQSKEEPAHQDATVQSTTDPAPTPTVEKQGVAKELEPADNDIRSDETEIEPEPVQPASKETVKADAQAVSDERAQATELTFEELIEEGATMAPVGFEDGAK